MKVFSSRAVASDRRRGWGTRSPLSRRNPLRPPVPPDNQATLAPTPGTRLGPYEVTAHIGVGGRTGDGTRHRRLILGWELTAAAISTVAGAILTVRARQGTPCEMRDRAARARGFVRSRLGLYSVFGGASLVARTAGRNASISRQTPKSHRPQEPPGSSLATPG